MRERRTGLVALALWTGLLILLTLFLHFAYAIWPWPDAPRGAGPLREAVVTERARVEELAAASSIGMISAVIEWTYRVGFEWTGMDYLMRSAMEKTPQDGTDEIGRRVASGAWAFLEPLYWSVQLIGLRLGVLFASLPLFLVAAIGGAADGAAAWYLRRVGVGRESGFIYHRAKLALWTALFALWAVYLLPPVALDPLAIIPPFVALCGLTVRIAVSWFKKYI